MPDVSGLYPQPPQPGGGFLTGDPMRTIGAIGELQNIGIRAQQAPALGQIPAANLRNTEISNQQQALQLQESARSTFLNAVVNGLPEQYDKNGNLTPHTAQDVNNAITNASRFLPQAVQLGAGGFVQDQLLRGGNIDRNIGAARASLLGPAGAAARVQGPVGGQGQPTQQGLGTITAAGGPIPTGLGPAQAGQMEMSQRQLSADQVQASNYKNQAVSLEQVLPLLKELGPSGTGLTFNIKKRLSEAGVAIGTDDSDAKVMEEIHKYLLRGVLTTGDTATNDKMWQSIASNPNESLVTGANIDLARVNLAQMRLKQAQVLEAGRRPQEAGPNGEKYSTWAPQFNTSQDPRAYVMDHYSPPERASILKQIQADRNSGNTSRVQKAQQFLDSYRVARTHPGLMDLTKLNAGQ